MSRDQLIDYKLDTGKEWISKYLKINSDFNAEEIAEMWKEPALLQWWNLEWRRMDHFIVLPILHKIAERNREEFYKAMHIDVFLSKHPSYKLLEISLARVIEKLLNTKK